MPNLAGSFVFSGGSLSGAYVFQTDAPPPGPTLGVPRLAFRQRTGEIFSLLLDADGIPYAYQRTNGTTVSLRPLDSVSLGVAVTDGGEMLILI
jgi:hypothetical protein